MIYKTNHTSSIYSHRNFQVWVERLETSGLMNEIPNWIDSGNIPDEVYDGFYRDSLPGFLDSMPYGTMKARTGDPVEWILNQLEGIYKFWKKGK